MSLKKLQNGLLNILNGDNGYHEFCRIFFLNFHNISKFQKKKKKEKEFLPILFYERARHDRGGFSN